MRMFLGIPVPEELSQHLYQHHAVLRNAWQGIRWSPPQNYHITLYFLGEVTQSVFRVLAERIASVLKDYNSFPLKTDRVCCFGSTPSPRLIFMGIDDIEGILQDLWTRLKPEIESFCGSQTQAFRPHITLGRVKRKGIIGPSGDKLLPVGFEEISAHGFQVRNIILYQSLLLPEGSQYKPLKNMDIGG